MKRSSALLVAALAFAACSRTADLARAPEPAPANVAESQPLASTIEEAKALLRNGQLDAFERGARALSTSSDAATKRAALAMLGVYYTEHERFADALPLLAEASNLNPEIAPYLQLRFLEAHSRLGNHSAAIGTANAIIAASPKSSAAIVARLRLPALYAAAGDVAATDAAWAEAALLPIDEFSESEFVVLANDLAKSGRTDVANAVRMRLLTDYTNGRETEATYAALINDPSAPIHALTEADSIAMATRLAKADRYDQALDFLERIAQRFPDSGTNADYRATRLRALFQSRHYAELLQETADVQLDDPALLLLIARAAWREDQPKQFLAGLAAIEKRFPSSKEALEAKVLRAKYYVTDETDYEKSISNLKAAIDAGVLGNEGENLWQLGFTYVLAEKYDDALATFDRYIATYEDGDYRTNSLFWSAKVFERRDEKEKRDARLQQIITEYPYNYYAYRAREILGNVAPASAGGASFPDLDTDLGTITDPRLAAIRALTEIDLYRDATREMKLLAADYPQNLCLAFMLAGLYVDGGEPFRASMTIQRRFRQFVRHGGTGIPPRFWRILFPLSYFDTIRKEADRQKLDAYLVASIIRQESGFEPTVVSNAGAVGLMQIMPQEATKIATEAGLSGVTREELFDPETNIAVGAAEYAQKLQTMSGDHILAIAAYNAGEEAVGRWLAQSPRSDVDLFVESIPYAETRLYVKSVNRNRHEYRRIYESSISAAERQSQ